MAQGTKYPKHIFYLEPLGNTAQNVMEMVTMHKTQWTKKCYNFILFILETPELFIFYPVFMVEK